MFDFIITRCRDKMDIHCTRAMRGPNCWTDHQMLRSEVAFKIQQKHNRQGTSKPTKLNGAKLSTISHRDSFEQNMDKSLAQWKEKETLTPDDECTALQQVVYNTAKTRSTRSTTAAYKDACRLLQKRTRALKSNWWERKAVELQRTADRNERKGFYTGLKEMWEPKK
ncbi:hypothetical protein NP493_295g09003 [Ridgeia piscesae]|uniref:Endonuclease-reverse transcriptase n=1 Tax=Ridgeia piscesae TaxID=27915 RepID=A0AAD9NWM9_RIDPI|nr:hypothetical protein NP493_295g09003 [Ridgeia piscesae]